MQVLQSYKSFLLRFAINEIIKERKSSDFYYRNQSQRALHFVWMKLSKNESVLKGKTKIYCNCDY